MEDCVRETHDSKKALRKTQAPMKLSNIKRTGTKKAFLFRAFRLFKRLNRLNAYMI